MEEEVDENELDLLETTDDSRHRLMYYLWNINELVDLSPVCPEIVHYLNYEQYCLNQDEERELYEICQRFSPLVFDSYCIINNDKLCPEGTHAIYPTNSIDRRECDYREFTIGGVRLYIHHVLTYKVKWIDRFYFTPIDILKRKVDSYKFVRKQSKMNLSIMTRPTPQTSRRNTVKVDLSLWLPSTPTQIGFHLMGLIYCIVFEVYTLKQYFGDDKKQFTFENVVFSTVGLGFELAGLLFSIILGYIWFIILLQFHFILFGGL